MKVGVLIVVVLAAVGLYVHHQSSGKMSAASLETLLYKDSLTWSPINPERENCQTDPEKKWDYLCTDNVGQVWGYNVNRVQVTGSDLIRGKDGTLVGSK
jgi:hypothetical protein